MNIVALPELEPYTLAYDALEKIPLTVTAVLRENSPLASYDPVHLDGLLAWSIVQKATHGAGVPNSDDPYRIPLPLECLHIEEGLPVWAASVFVAATAAISDTVYWHKRAMSGRFSSHNNKPLSIKTVAGRWMERRVPVPVRVAHKWRARCVAHPETILGLLSRVAFMGKKRGVGFGEVVEWIVAPDESEEPVYLQDGCLARSLPLPAFHALSLPLPTQACTLIGWTPPAWKPSLFRPGWPVGTRITA